MYSFFFYIFFILCILSCIFIVFWQDRQAKEFPLTLFLLSSAGLINLINGGYISFIMLISAAVYFSLNNLKNIFKKPGNNNKNKLLSPNIIHLLIISITGALIASLSGSTMWQGQVRLQKEITLADFGGTISGEYFIFFLVIFVSLFLLSFKPGQKHE